MGAPPRIKPKSLDDYLEQLSKSVFQAGISWRVVDAKWSTIKPAFRGFHVEHVARMGDREIDALASDPRVIRSRPKIAAVVHNPSAILDLERGGGFRIHLWTVSHPVPDWRVWAKVHGITWAGKAEPKKAAPTTAKTTTRKRTRRRPARS